MHNMREMWCLIYLCAMRTVPTSCHMLLHVQCHHAHIMQRMHAGKTATLSIHGMPEITYGRAIHAS